MENGLYDYPDDYERIYSLYPGKRGNKKSGWRKWAARRREGVSQKDLVDAVKNYAAECQKENRSEKYIKHIATFFGPDEHWRGYLKGGNNEFSGTSSREEKEDEEESIFNE